MIVKIKDIFMTDKVKIQLTYSYNNHNTQSKQMNITQSQASRDQQNKIHSQHFHTDEV